MTTTLPLVRTFTLREESRYIVRLEIPVLFSERAGEVTMGHRV